MRKTNNMNKITRLFRSFPKKKERNFVWTLTGSTRPKGQEDLAVVGVPGDHLVQLRADRALEQGVIALGDGGVVAADHN